MKWKLACAAGVMLVACQSAFAQFNSSVALVSEYDYRGFSQSARDPALQGSLDYDFGNGFAIGAWASNIDWEPADGDIEVDYYASFTSPINEAASWSLGAQFYSFPGSDDIGEYPEYFFGLAFGNLDFRQWYSDNLYDTDESAWYTEGNAMLALPQDFSLLLHGGFSWGDAWDSMGGEIIDYGIGFGYDVRNLSLSLMLVGTDASGDQKVTDDVGNNEARVVFGVSTTLPWEN